MFSHFGHSSLEVDAALGAVDDDPLVRHPHLGMVVCDVIGPSSELKVLKPVVVLDLVEMVDVLVLPESASKVALHDETMLEDVEASAGELNVAVSSDASGDVSSAALTRAETHVAPCCPAGLDGEVSSARFAGESDSHSSPPSMWWRRSISPPDGTTLNGLRAHTTGS